MRTIVDLPQEQVEALSQVCEQDNISRAEAIRRAVSQMLKARSGASRESAFGAWKDRGEDSAQIVAELRDEWE